MIKKLPVSDKLEGERRSKFREDYKLDNRQMTKFQGVFRGRERGALQFFAVKMQNKSLVKNVCWSRGLLAR